MPSFGRYEVACEVLDVVKDRERMMPARRNSFVLASRSPRRRQLLGALGLDFTVDAADVDETPLPGEAPDALVCRLCRAKAAAVAERHPGEVVLAADTLVVLEGALLGKPADPLEAVAMLAALRDRVHVVYTALCVMRDGAERDACVRDRRERCGRTPTRRSRPTLRPAIRWTRPAPTASRTRSLRRWQSWDGLLFGRHGAAAGAGRGDAWAGRHRAAPRDVAAACETMTGDRCCERDGGLAASRREPCGVAVTAGRQDTLCR